MTWGGRWGAIDVFCEALFRELFRTFERRVPRAENSRGASRRPPETSWSLLEPFADFFDKNKKSAFFMKVQHQIVFCYGRGKILNNFI